MSWAADGAAAGACGAADWASIVEPANRVKARARASVLQFIMMVPVLPRPGTGSVCRLYLEIEPRQAAPTMPSPNP